MTSCLAIDKDLKAMSDAAAIFNFTKANYWYERGGNSIKVSQQTVCIHTNVLGLGVRMTTYIIYALCFMAGLAIHSYFYVAFG